jgi:uncharacterized protein
MSAHRRRGQSHESVVLDAPEGRPFRIVVVSDTHSVIHPNTAGLVKELHADHMFHGGDIGDLGILEKLRGMAPLTAVRGNIDGQVTEVPESIDIAVRSGSRVLLKILLMHIAVYGPKVRAEAWRLAQQYGSRMIVCGHSHVPFMGRDKGLVLFNPGSIGPRRGSLPITLGLLEIGLSGINLKHVSCETGQTWSP